MIPVHWRKLTPPFALYRSEPMQTLPLGDPPPAFGCHIDLIDTDDGRVRGTVVNVRHDGRLSATADHDRVVMSKLVPEFRTFLGEQTAAGSPLQWIEPPPPKPDQARRVFLPVHG